MAGFSPYDKVEWAEYTPLSSQEILSPAMMMRDRHDALDAEIGETNNQLQKIASIAKNDPNPIVREQFEAFENEVINSRDTLMNEGYTPQVKRNLLDLKGKYTAEIAPYEMAHELKRQDLIAQQQKKMQDDSYIGEDINSRSLVDYVGNGLQPMSSRGVSGNQITNMVRETLAPYSKEITKNSVREAYMKYYEHLTEKEVDVLINEYYKNFKQYGYKEGDAGYVALLNLAGDRVKSVLGLDEADWVQNNENIKKSIDEAIALGGSAAFGGSDISYMSRKDLNNSIEKENPWSEGLNVTSVDTGVVVNSKNKYLTEDNVITWDSDTNEFKTTNITNNLKRIEELKLKILEEDKNIEKSKNRTITPQEKHRYAPSLARADEMEKSKNNRLKSIEKLKEKLEKLEEGTDEYNKISEAILNFENQNIKAEEQIKNLRDVHYSYNASSRANKKSYENEINKLEKQIQEETNELYRIVDTYKHLGDNDSERLSNGLLLENTQAAQTKHYAIIKEKTPELANLILEGISMGMVNPNQKRNSHGLLLLTNDFKEEDKDNKSSWASKETIQELIKNKNARVWIGEDGLIINDGNNNYKIIGGDDSTKNTNKLMKDIVSFANDYTKEPILLNNIKANSEPTDILNSIYNIINTDTNGDTYLWDSEDLLINTFNFKDGDNGYNKAFVFRYKNSNNEWDSKLFLTSFDDEVTGRSDYKRMMNFLTPLLISSLLRDHGRYVQKEEKNE